MGTVLRYEEMEEKLKRLTRKELLITFYRGSYQAYHEECMQDVCDGTSANRDIIPLLCETEVLLESKPTKGAFGKKLYWLIVSTFIENSNLISSIIPSRLGFFEIDEFVLVSFDNQKTLSKLQNMVITIFKGGKI